MTNTLNQVCKISICLLTVFSLGLFLTSCGEYQEDNNMVKQTKVAILYSSNILNLIQDATVLNDTKATNVLISTLQNNGFDSSNLARATIANEEEEEIKIQELIEKKFDTIIFYNLQFQSQSFFLDFNKKTKEEQEKTSSNLAKTLDKAKKKGIKLINFGKSSLDYSWDYTIIEPSSKDIADKQIEYLSPKDTTISKVLVLADNTDTNESFSYIQTICSKYKKKVIGKICDSKYTITNSDLIDNANQDNIDNEVLRALSTYIPKKDLINSIFPINSSFNGADLILTNNDFISKSIVSILAKNKITPKLQFDNYPVILGSGGNVTAIQNIVDSKQKATIIQNNVFAFTTLSNLLYNNYSTIPYTASQNPFNKKKFITPLTIVDIHSIKTKLIDSGFISPGETGL